MTENIPDVIGFIGATDTKVDQATAIARETVQESHLGGILENYWLKGWRESQGLSSKFRGMWEETKTYVKDETSRITQGRESRFGRIFSLTTIRREYNLHKQVERAEKEIQTTGTIFAKDSIYLARQQAEDEYWTMSKDERKQFKEQAAISTSWLRRRHDNQEAIKVRTLQILKEWTEPDADGNYRIKELALHKRTSQAIAEAYKTGAVADTDIILGDGPEKHLMLASDHPLSIKFRTIIADYASSQMTKDVMLDKLKQAISETQFTGNESSIARQIVQAEFTAEEFTALAEHYRNGAAHAGGRSAIEADLETKTFMLGAGARFAEYTAAERTKGERLMGLLQKYTPLTPETSAAAVSLALATTDILGKPLSIASKKGIQLGAASGLALLATVPLAPVIGTGSLAALGIGAATIAAFRMVQVRSRMHGELRTELRRREGGDTTKLAEANPSNWLTKGWLKLWGDEKKVLNECQVSQKSATDLLTSLRNLYIENADNTKSLNIANERDQKNAIRALTDVLAYVRATEHQGLIDQGVGLIVFDLEGDGQTPGLQMLQLKTAVAAVRRDLMEREADNTAKAALKQQITQIANLKTAAIEGTSARSKLSSEEKHLLDNYGRLHGYTNLREELKASKRHLSWYAFKQGAKAAFVSAGLGRVALAAGSTISHFRELRESVYPEHTTLLGAVIDELRDDSDAILPARSDEITVGDHIFKLPQGSIFKESPDSTYSDLHLPDGNILESFVDRATGEINPSYTTNPSEYDLTITTPPIPTPNQNPLTDTLAITLDSDTSDSSHLIRFENNNLQLTLPDGQELEIPHAVDASGRLSEDHFTQLRDTLASVYHIKLEEEFEPIADAPFTSQVSQQITLDDHLTLQFPSTFSLDGDYDSTTGITTFEIQSFTDESSTTIQVLIDSDGSVTFPDDATETLARLGYHLESIDLTDHVDIDTEVTTLLDENPLENRVILTGEDIGPRGLWGYVENRLDETGIETDHPNGTINAVKNAAFSIHEQVDQVFVPYDTMSGTATTQLPEVLLNGVDILDAQIDIALDHLEAGGQIDAAFMEEHPLAVYSLRLGPGIQGNQWALDDALTNYRLSSPEEVEHFLQLLSQEQADEVTHHTVHLNFDPAENMGVTTLKLSPLEPNLSPTITLIDYDPDVIPLLDPDPDLIYPYAIPLPDIQTTSPRTGTSPDNPEPEPEPPLPTDFNSLVQQGMAQNTDSFEFAISPDALATFLAGLSLGNNFTLTQPNLSVEDQTLHLTDAIITNADGQITTFSASLQTRDGKLELIDGSLVFDTVDEDLIPYIADLPTTIADHLKSQAGGEWDTDMLITSTGQVQLYYYQSLTTDILSQTSTQRLFTIPTPDFTPDLTLHAGIPPLDPQGQIAPLTTPTIFTTFRMNTITDGNPKIKFEHGAILVLPVESGTSSPIPYTYQGLSVPDIVSQYNTYAQDHNLPLVKQVILQPPAGHAITAREFQHDIDNITTNYYIPTRTSLKKTGDQNILELNLPTYSPDYEPNLGGLDPSLSNDERREQLKTILDSPNVESLEEQVAKAIGLNKTFGLEHFIQSAREQLHSTKAEWISDPNWQTRWLSNLETLNIADNYSIPLAFMFRGNHAYALTQPPIPQPDGSYAIHLYNPFEDGEDVIYLTEKDASKRNGDNIIYISNAIPRLGQAISGNYYDSIAARLDQANYNLTTPEITGKEHLTKAKQGALQENGDTFNCTLWTIFYAAMNNAMQPGPNPFKDNGYDQWHADFGFRFYTYEEVRTAGAPPASPEPDEPETSASKFVLQNTGCRIETNDERILNPDPSFRQQITASYQRLIATNPTNPLFLSFSGPEKSDLYQISHTPGASDEITSESLIITPIGSYDNASSDITDLTDNEPQGLTDLALPENTTEIQFFTGIPIQIDVAELEPPSPPLPPPSPEVDTPSLTIPEKLAAELPDLGLTKINDLAILNPNEEYGDELAKIYGRLIQTNPDQPIYISFNTPSGSALFQLIRDHEISTVTAASLSLLPIAAYAVSGGFSRYRNRKPILPTTLINGTTEIQFFTGIPIQIDVAEPEPTSPPPATPNSETTPPTTEATSEPFAIDSVISKFSGVLSHTRLKPTATSITSYISDSGATMYTSTYTEATTDQPSRQTRDASNTFQSLAHLRYIAFSETLEPGQEIYLVQTTSDGSTIYRLTHVPNEDPSFIPIESIRVTPVAQYAKNTNQTTRLSDSDTYLDQFTASTQDRFDFLIGSPIPETPLPQIPEALTEALDLQPVLKQGQAATFQPVPRSIGNTNRKLSLIVRNHISTPGFDHSTRSLYLSYKDGNDTHLFRIIHHADDLEPAANDLKIARVTLADDNQVSSQPPQTLLDFFTAHNQVDTFHLHHGKNTLEP